MEEKGDTMKKIRGILLAGFSAVLFAVAFCPVAPALHAQNRTQYASAQQQQPSQQQSKTFTGKIAQLQNGKYALVTGKSQQGGLTGHYLDDPKDAKNFVGKDVKVTGTLDVGSNTIHVTNIQLA